MGAGSSNLHFCTFCRPSECSTGLPMAVPARRDHRRSSTQHCSCNSDSGTTPPLSTSSASSRAASPMVPGAPSLHISAHRGRSSASNRSSTPMTPHGARNTSLSDFGVDNSPYSAAICGFTGNSVHSACATPLGGSQRARACSSSFITHSQVHRRSCTPSSIASVSSIETDETHGRDASICTGSELSASGRPSLMPRCIARATPSPTCARCEAGTRTPLRSQHNSLSNTSSSGAVSPEIALHCWNVPENDDGVRAFGVMPKPSVAREAPDNLSARSPVPIAPSPVPASLTTSVTSALVNSLAASCSQPPSPAPPCTPTTSPVPSTPTSRAAPPAMMETHKRRKRSARSNYRGQRERQAANVRLLDGGGAVLVIGVETGANVDAGMSGPQNTHVGTDTTKELAALPRRRCASDAPPRGVQRMRGSHGLNSICSVRVQPAVLLQLQKQRVERRGGHERVESNRQQGILEVEVAHGSVSTNADVALHSEVRSATTDSKHRTPPMKIPRANNVGTGSGIRQALNIDSEGVCADVACDSETLCNDIATVSSHGVPNNIGLGKPMPFVQPPRDVGVNAVEDFTYPNGVRCEKISSLLGLRASLRQRLEQGIGAGSGAPIDHHAADIGVENHTMTSSHTIPPRRLLSRSCSEREVVESDRRFSTTFVDDVEDTASAGACRGRVGNGLFALRFVVSENGTEQMYGFGATVPAVVSTLGLFPGKRRSRPQSKDREMHQRAVSPLSHDEEDEESIFLGSEVFLVLSKWPFARLMLAALREAAEQHTAHVEALINDAVHGLQKQVDDIAVELAEAAEATGAERRNSENISDGVKSGVIGTLRHGPSRDLPKSCSDVKLPADVMRSLETKAMRELEYKLCAARKRTARRLWGAMANMTVPARGGFCRLQLPALDSLRHFSREQPRTSMSRLSTAYKTANVANTGQACSAPTANDCLSDVSVTSNTMHVWQRPASVTGIGASWSPKPGLSQGSLEANDAETNSLLAEWAVPALLRSLSIDNVVLLTGLLATEMQVVVVGAAAQDRSAAALALPLLLHPLSWSQSGWPLLCSAPSYMATDLLDAPVPMIMALERMPEGLEVKEGQAIVYLDRNHVKLHQHDKLALSTRQLPRQSTIANRVNRLVAEARLHNGTSTEDIAAVRGRILRRELGKELMEICKVGMSELDRRGRMRNRPVRSDDRDELSTPKLTASMSSLSLVNQVISHFTPGDGQNTCTNSINAECGTRHDPSDRLSRSLGNKMTHETANFIEAAIGTEGQPFCGRRQGHGGCCFLHRFGATMLFKRYSKSIEGKDMKGELRKTAWYWQNHAVRKRHARKLRSLHDYADEIHALMEPSSEVSASLLGAPPADEVDQFSTEQSYFASPSSRVNCGHDRKREPFFSDACASTVTTATSSEVTGCSRASEVCAPTNLRLVRQVTAPPMSTQCMDKDGAKLT